MKTDWIKPFIIFVLVGVLPLVVNHDYYQHLMILVLMWVVIGSSWNLLAGYTGQSFSMRPQDRGLRPVSSANGFSAVGMLLGASAVILGLFIGYLCFRLRGLFCPGRMAPVKSCGWWPTTGWTLQKAW
jgi:branched-chain amino acid transport system permease protein